MVATPYPLPRSLRRTDVLAGDGGADYGPFGDGWGIFDVDDVAVWLKEGGSPEFIRTTDFTVTRSDPSAAYSPFSITFDYDISAADSFYVEGSRLHERSLAVTRGGQIDSEALEREFSKTAVVLQEQHRDIDDMQVAIEVQNQEIDSLLTGATDVPVMASMAALQALGSTFTRPLVFLLSFTSALRSGAGFWAYDATDTASAHDGLTVAVDAAGRRWKPVAMPPSPRPHEVIDLLYYLSRYSDTAAGHRLALIEAHKALFNDAARVPARLECHGIQLLIDQPVKLRYADLGFGAGEGKAEKTVANLHIKRTSGAYAWATRDFLYSIAGLDGSGTLRYFTLERPVVNLGNSDVIGLHVSGYYHAAIKHPIIRGLTGTGIGIYSSKYDSAGPGVGKPGGSPVDNGNHGLLVETPDIRGTSGADADLTTGVYLEDGDAEVKGGWMTFLNEGIVSKRGGMNVSQVHFSMADRANMTVAIRCDAPRATAITDCEFDGSAVLFDNPTDNMWSEGTSLEQWATLAVVGGKFSGARTPGGSTAGFGHINFKTRTANNFLKGLYLAGPEWAGDSIETVKFLTSGSGSWLGSSFNEILYNPPHSSNSIAGVTFPAGVKIRLARVGSAAAPYGLRMDVATGNIEMPNPTSGGDTPYFGPNGKGLRFGRNEAGVFVPYWEFSDSGEHLRPSADVARDIGAAAQRVKDLYLGGATRLAARAATAVAGAATLNEYSGTITTEALTTIAGNTYVLTLTNSQIDANDLVFATVSEGTSTGGLPCVCRVQPAAGSCVINIRNVHSSGAFNGTLNVGFIVMKVA